MPPLTPAGPAVSPRRFAAFRILFGAYLALWLASLVPWAGELFGDDGIPGLPGASPSRLPGMLGWLLPSHLPRELAPWAVGAFAALALLVASGVARRAAALGVWLGLVWLYDRNPGLHNPSLGYLGWICLALAVTPPREPLRILARRPDDPAWSFPPGLFAGAWWILALAYTVSGLDKLSSLAWTEGHAIRWALDLPWARPGPLRDALLALPGGALAFLTWGVLATELLFAPLALVRRLRPWVWLAALALHVGLAGAMAFPQLSIGMAMAHFFTFDERWLRRGASPGGDTRAGRDVRARPGREAAQMELPFHERGTGLP